MEHKLVRCQEFVAEKATYALGAVACVQRCIEDSFAAGATEVFNLKAQILECFVCTEDFVLCKKGVDKAFGIEFYGYICSV
jgi:hypothetical protein